jgi:hypothetical protein
MLLWCLLLENTADLQVIAGSTYTHHDVIAEAAESTEEIRLALVGGPAALDARAGDRLAGAGCFD